jgi:hypothetical protein
VPVTVLDVDSDIDFIRAERIYNKIQKRKIFIAQNNNKMKYIPNTQHGVSI